MSERSTEPIRELLDSLYRVDSGRILATLIRLLGDFDLAEEAMQEAFAAALDTRPQAGVQRRDDPVLGRQGHETAVREKPWPRFLPPVRRFEPNSASNRILSTQNLVDEQLIHDYRSQACSHVRGTKHA